MVPVTLVTGFLGAGKTTLLSRVLRDPQGLRFAVLVNDFGSINIDAELLRESGEEIVALQNGCICCSLSQGLQATVASVLRRPDPPDRMLIEASGIADPFEIAATLADPELRPYAPLDGIVTVVDAERMTDPDPQIVPLAARQVACAGLILLNKIDLPRDGCAAARSWLRSVARDVPIVETRNADVPLSTLLGVGATVAGPVPAAAALSFESTTFTCTTPIPIRRVHAALGALPPGVVRAKGVVNLVEKPAHRCILQCAAGQATLTVGQPWDGEEPATRLVFIGLPGSFDAGWIRTRFGE
jgi:G3E family GTPase